MVSKLALSVGVLLCLLVAINARSFDKGDHGDMEAAASGKSYKHGGGKEYHDEHKESHGKKGNEREKNYLVVKFFNGFVLCRLYFQYR